VSINRMVLVCGAAEDAELWTDVIARSPAPTLVVELEPIDELEQLVAAVERHVQPGDVVIGHSLGGAVAVLLAARGSAPAAGWVVVSCGTALPVHDATWATLREGGVDALAAQFAVAAAGGRRAAEEDPASAAIAARMEAMVLRHRDALEPHLRACAAFSAAGVSAAGGHVAVVCGARDRLVAPQLMTDLGDRFAAPTTVVETAAHQVPWEAPEAIIEAALRVA
jgi:pimeloyl-ACP methyl ester carboxylesterase